MFVLGNPFRPTFLTLGFLFDHFLKSHRFHNSQSRLVYVLDFDPITSLQSPEVDVRLIHESKNHKHTQSNRVSRSSPFC